MSWLFLVLFSVIVTSFAAILLKVLMKDDKSNPYSYAVAFHILIAVLTLTFALFHGFQLPQLSTRLIFFLIAAVLWGGTTILLFKALQLLEASEVTILSSARVLVTIMASILFLGETYNAPRVLGTAIILISILLVTELKNGLKFNKGVWYVFGMALFSGLAIVADAYNVRHYDAASYNAIINFLIGFMILAFYPKVLKQLKHFIQPNFINRMLPIAIFSSIQAIAYVYALENGVGHAAQIGTIRQSQVIVTVILAAIFLKERSNLVRKLTAAALVTSGVILLR